MRDQFHIRQAQQHEYDQRKSLQRAPAQQYHPARQRRRQHRGTQDDHHREIRVLEHRIKEMPVFRRHRQTRKPSQHGECSGERLNPEIQGNAIIAVVEYNEDPDQDDCQQQYGDRPKQQRAPPVLPRDIEPEHQP